MTLPNGNGLQSNDAHPETPSPRSLKPESTEGRREESGRGVRELQGK